MGDNWEGENPQYYRNQEIKSRFPRRLPAAKALSPLSLLPYTTSHLPCNPSKISK